MRPPRLRRARLGFASSSGVLALGGRGLFLLGGLACGLLGGLGLLLGALGGFLLELGGDGRVVFGAQIDLFVGGSGLGSVGLQILLSLEGLDLLDGDVELVRDPCVGTTLSHPPTDLVKLGTQGPATHERPVG